MAAFRAGPGTPELSAALATRCASDRAKEHATSPVRRARAARRPPDPAVARTAQDERSRVPRLAAVRAGRAAVPAADGAVTTGTRKAARTALQALSGSIIVRVARVFALSGTSTGFRPERRRARLCGSLALLFIL
jgi:hypothetical protein